MSTVTGRLDRRRARTRRALVDAARRLLEGGGTTDVSIQEITEEADVGLGSFYNHFTSKAELFETAVAEVLEELGLVIDAAGAGMEDAAEVLALGVRLTARLATRRPSVARVLVHSGSAFLAADHGLAPRARRDLQRGIDTGRFTVTDADLALVVVGGAVLTYLEVGLADPGHLGDDDADTLAEMLLRAVGLPARSAASVARRPLPAVPDSA